MANNFWRKTAALLPGFIFLWFFACAQREGNIWYFGNKAGIDFNTGAPFPLTDGAMSTLQGCATISNAAGKLLFYTNGVNVYDRTHELMPHGTGLAGSNSSTQSAIIIPKPLSTSVYYIFTVDVEMGPNGLEYSVVDMNANGGLGDVVTKNVKIKTPVCEKLTAVQHFNKKDYWVLAHDGKSGYLAYLVTDSGVRTTPVVSSNGVDFSSSNFNAKGYLKVSSGGNKLADAIKFLNMVEFADFDNNTGKVSNQQVIPNVNTAYGIEFSPDNTKLYVTNYFDQQLYQFDISSGNISDVINSRDTIFISTVSVLSAMQQAPDGKIYVSRDNHSQMGVINAPNKRGKACNYNDQGFDLNGRKCYSGLPTFIQSFFIPATDFTFFNTCLGDETQFVGKTNINADKWLWNFDDPVSGSNNTDSRTSPTHAFSGAGTYHVVLVLYYNGLTDTVAKDVEISNVPKVDLGPDIVTCSGQPVVLDAKNPGFKYLWSTHDTTQQIKTDSSGTYWVQVSKNTCQRSDTVKISFLNIGDFGLGKDTVVCAGSGFTLKEKLKDARIFWSTGETDTAITVYKTGYYWVKVTLGTCTVIDSVLVFFESPPPLNLGKDTMVCEGNIDTLDTHIKGVYYLWSTGATTQKIPVHEAGQYWARIKSTGCTVYDTINIYHCPANLYIPNAFSPNGDQLNDRFKIGGTDIGRAYLTIVNRWGEVVYQGDDPNGWDGTFHGETCATGLYGFVLIYRSYEGAIGYDHQLSGRFLLVR